jgi:hypothetical protein
MALERLEALLGKERMKKAEEAARLDEQKTEKAAAKEEKEEEEGEWYDPREQEMIHAFSDDSSNLYPGLMKAEKGSNRSGKSGQRRVKQHSENNVKIGADFAAPAHDSLNRYQGQLAPAGVAFCPILAVAKFPYKHMQANTEESEKVSIQFFAADLFWTRAWTV